MTIVVDPKRERDDEVRIITHQSVDGTYSEAHIPQTLSCGRLGNASRGSMKELFYPPTCAAVCEGCMSSDRPRIYHRVA